VKQALKEFRDDADLQTDTIVFWTQVEVNRLRGERFSKRHQQSGQYLAHFYGVTVTNDGVRKYVEMPAGIIDVENDLGLHQVTYHLADYDYCDYPYDVPFEKTMPAKIWSLLAIPIRNPKPTRPFMAREGESLFFYGIENINVSSVDMWLYTTVDTTHKLDLTESIELEDGQVSVLIQRVLALVRFASLFPNDKTNFGSDGNTQALGRTAVSNTAIANQEQPQQ
jgi:hypothetical protein